MVLLVGRHTEFCRSFRTSLAKSGLLTVSCMTGDVLQAVETYEPAVVMFLEPERHAVTASLALFLKCKYPHILRFALYQDEHARQMCIKNQELLHGFYPYTVRTLRLRDILLKMLWEVVHIDRADMIYGFVRISVYDHVTNYRIKYIPVGLPTYAVIRYLILKSPQPVPVQELMDVCLAPLGVRHRAAVSQIARRYNALAKSQRVGNDQPGPIVYLPRRGYFLDDW